MERKMLGDHDCLGVPKTCSRASITFEVLRTLFVKKFPKQALWLLVGAIRHAIHHFACALEKLGYPPVHLLAHLKFPDSAVRCIFAAQPKS